MEGIIGMILNLIIIQMNREIENSNLPLGLVFMLYEIFIQELLRIILM